MKDDKEKYDQKGDSALSAGEWIPIRQERG